MRIERAYRGGYEGRPGWWFAFTFNEDKIAALKATVPAPERSWSEERKEWWVSDSAFPQALTVFPSLEAYLRQAPLF